MLKSINLINEYIDDVQHVININSRNAIINLIKNEIKSVQDATVYVGKLMVNMDFKKEITKAHCKQFMEECGFTYPEDIEDDRSDPTNIVRSISRKVFTPVSRQDLEVIGNPDPMHINDIIDEGMKEYGYKKSDDGKWIEPEEICPKQDLTTVVSDAKSAEARPESKKKAKTSKRKNRIKITKEEKNEQ